MNTADYKRLLKYPLHPADVLFFRCIPGNTGERLFPMLESRFAPDAIFPPHVADSEETFARYTDEARAGFRLVRGNLEYGTGDGAVYRYLARNPIKMTWLRHPISRAVELHQQALASGRIAPSTSLGAYVQSPQGRLDLCNAQARAIVGETTRAAPGHDTLGYSAEAFKKLAEDNLEQHHFVGLAEEVERSARLLNYTFDWEPGRSDLSAAATPTEIDPEVRAAILRQADYDLAFYEYARALFDARYRQMEDEIVDRRTKPPKGEGRQKARAMGLFARIARAVRRRLPGYQPPARGQKRRKRAGGADEKTSRRARGAGKKKKQ